MKKNEKEMVDELLQGKENLKCELLYERGYEFVKKVLEMPEWENPKFKDLLTTAIWRKNIDEINEILQMPEWNDERYKELLTSSIWYSNAKEIRKILEIPKWKDERYKVLLTSSIWTSNSEEVKKILEMPEWNNERFQDLLTSNIWKNSYDAIKEKLNLPYWEDNKYQHLLVPSIFSISLTNIHNGIQLLENYGIGQYVTNKCLRYKTDTLRKLIQHLVDNNIDLVVADEKKVGYKLNPILSAEKGQLKTKFNIDINKIEKTGEER